MNLNWQEYEELATRAAAEGCVLLKNKGNMLPLKKGTIVAVFGRMQEHYYKSGLGSGGLVNVDYVYDIPSAIEELGELTLYEPLRDIYREWEVEHPLNKGEGWGKDPFSQEEWDVPQGIIKDAARNADEAIVIIARTAGEDRDSDPLPGSYYLSDAEKNLIKNVKAIFGKVVVVYNTGNIMDVSFDDEVDADAIILSWQAGMVGGLGLASILCGDISPSGHLPDTMAYKLEDYPSYSNFGKSLTDMYAEDVYVGYRYFETFAKKEVRYPFGFGLTYTQFKLDFVSCKLEDNKYSVTVRVKNIGEYAAREVVQIYVSKPRDIVDNPALCLAGFGKTAELKPNEETRLVIEFPIDRLAAYSDINGDKYRFTEAIRQGKYVFYMGENVRDVKEIYSYEQEETQVIYTLNNCLFPNVTYRRMTLTKFGNLDYFTVPTRPLYDMNKRRIPEEIPMTGDKGYKLKDVYDGNVTMEEFVGQLSVEELCCLTRGEGMGSPKVTPGTASAFGGVAPGLVDKGIPAVCCSDGPSGLRIDSGIKAFSLPNGTLLAATFDTELNEKLFTFLGYEMKKNKVDILLGPGMNIHRFPLNGRNFEYFSEDPVLTGLMGLAQARGLNAAGSIACLKHFAANNREKNRRLMDSVVSSRALREIYLKGFEIVIREDDVDVAVMTTYGSLNGYYTAGNYELNTLVLREDWGFDGLVMTDWWADINRPGEKPCGNDLAQMIKAQNDIYMCVSDASRNSSDDNLEAEIESGDLKISELQRTAVNVLETVLKTTAFRRLIGQEDEVVIENGPKQDVEDISGVSYIKLEDGLELDMQKLKAGSERAYVFALDAEPGTNYDVTITGVSDLDKLAQLPVNLFYMGFPIISCVFTGSNGQETSITREISFETRFNVYRLLSSNVGLKILKLKFTYKGTHEVDTSFGYKEEL